MYTISVGPITEPFDSIPVLLSDILLRATKSSLFSRPAGMMGTSAVIFALSALLTVLATLNHVTASGVLKAEER